MPDAPTEPATPDRPPILIPCEGSDLPGHQAICPPTHGMCQMCGQVRSLNEDGTMPPHNRKDIVAMIDRGDFG